ncbi:MAG: SPASM domain-containing protein [bacterium]
MYISDYLKFVDIHDLNTLYSHFVYHAFYGNIAFIEKEVFEVIDYIKKNPTISFDDEIRSCLLKAHYGADDPGIEHEEIKNIKTLINQATKSYIQIGLLFHPKENLKTKINLETLPLIMNALGTLFHEKEYTRCIFYLWLTDLEAGELFYDFAEKLTALISKPENSKIQFLFVITTHGTFPLDYSRLSVLKGQRVVFKIILHEFYHRAFPSTDAYCDQILRTMKQTAQWGFISEVHLDITERSKEIMLNEIYDALIMSGIYGNIFQDIKISASMEQEGEPDLICDFKECNWGLVQYLIETVGKKRKYNVAALWGAGVIPKFHSIIAAGQKFIPDIHYCPFVKNSYVFDLDGSLWSCLKACHEHTMPEANVVGKYLPQLLLFEDKLQYWRGRAVTSIEGCQGCSHIFLCSGGCPYAAQLKSHTIYAPLCQPVDAFLTTGIRANMNKLLREFTRRRSSQGESEKKCP